MEILKNFIIFFRENNLTQYSKIKRLSGMIQFNQKTAHNQLRLVEFFTKKDNDFYNIYQAKKENNYTAVPQYYRANIHNINYLISLSRVIEIDYNEHNITHISKAYSQDEIKNINLILEEIDKKKNISNLSQLIKALSRNNNLEIRKDKEYFSLKNNKKIKLEKRIKTIYKFEINNWITKKSTLLKKYNTNKYHYNFESDMKDILNHIQEYLKKYTLIKISNNVLKNNIQNHKINSINTKKKFIDMISNKNLITYDLFKNDYVSFLNK
jgi:hypothetical protein